MDWWQWGLMTNQTNRSEAFKALLWRIMARSRRATERILFSESSRNNWENLSRRKAQISSSQSLLEEGSAWLRGFVSMTWVSGSQGVTFRSSPITAQLWWSSRPSRGFGSQILFHLEKNEISLNSFCLFVFLPKILQVCIHTKDYSIPMCLKISTQSK